MKYVLYAFTALYGLLSFIAAISQIKKAKKKASFVIMAVGALILVAAIVIDIISLPYSWVGTTVGGLLICGAAIYNGKASGNFHTTHHIIRFAVILLLIVGFIL